MLYVPYKRNVEAFHMFISDNIVIVKFDIRLKGLLNSRIPLDQHTIFTKNPRRPLLLHFVTINGKAMYI